MGILDEGYGIIPKSVMKDGRIDVYGKAIIAYLLSYTGKGKIECWPSIETISTDLQISRGKTIESIKQLQDIHYLVKDRLYCDDPMKKHNMYRLIILESTEDLSAYFRSSPGELSKSTPKTSEVHPMNTNNHILNNHIINNINTSAKAEDGIIPIDIKAIEYLNTKTHSKFRLTPKYKALIAARVKEGYSRADFKTVIDNMCRVWLNDPKMRPYLRPMTLFSTKFDSYLNRKDVGGY